MLQIPTWSKVVTALILLAGFLIALPNALPQSVLDHYPSFMPKQTVALGLDLQGGAYRLLEVELDKVRKDRLTNLLGDMRIALRKANIGYKEIQSDSTQAYVVISDPAQFAQAKDIISGLNPLATGSVLGGATREYTLTAPGNGKLVMQMSDGYLRQLGTEIVNQSIEVVRRRIDALGTREPTIERQGDDRIVVQVPGLTDPARLDGILGKTAKMTFQLVDESASQGTALADAERGIVPIGDELLMEASRAPGAPETPIVVQKRVAVAGNRLTHAAPELNQQTGLWVVIFRFDSIGAREFGNITKDNLGRRFAVVLDGKVITAPVIQTPILGGTGEISGNFTADSAQDLSVLLNAGALPAPLKTLEQRTVGAELGADSVRAGKYSAIGGLLMVAAFMILRYGLFGLFADIALTLNVVLLMALLTLFGATLTLPGIAGIVLTMGMAVDANVLIYERIREEIRNGRSIVASIDTGFRRAMATIIDANMTHVIASAILFELGSGPVRGFAVTLLIGIITSFFTAVMVTRLIVVTWFQSVRPKMLHI